VSLLLAVINTIASCMCKVNNQGYGEKKHFRSKHHLYRNRKVPETTATLIHTRKNLSTYLLLKSVQKSLPISNDRCRQFNWDPPLCSEIIVNNESRCRKGLNELNLVLRPSSFWQTGCLRILLRQVYNQWGDDVCSKNHITTLMVIVVMCMVSWIFIQWP